MKLTWYGHSAFAVETGANKILIDPFLTGNPSWGKGWEEVADGVTHVLLTHGHNDHFGDTISILKQTGAMLVANAEISDYVAGQGIENVNPGNHGGTLDCGGFTVTLVNALHSSAFTLENGSNIYLGNPAGLVLHFPDDKTLYHMGDTDIFGDMALINELHQPRIGIVPIGDRFTMGGAVAALACQRYFDFETVIPCHYGTFPIIDETADKFVEGMKGAKAQVKVARVGAAFEV
ncbi:metal-dependent hydrolase [Chelativorans sp. ZYF759]|uniref:metal-dependent hydrolase n=1 Tax=Chelativorans sp. ZYF759 TaxID=2692213 RepID=UPI00145F144B|nr:metal-dependent hydrolase [Chelativorans sp. ZYF759]NMG39146.1 metal-dependent hydrolase [Chelativorans sp. ZYF759]